MSMDVLGLFLFGLFSFVMGRDYNPEQYELSSSDTGSAIFATWALVGCFSFLFGWFSFSGGAA